MYTLDTADYLESIEILFGRPLSEIADLDPFNESDTFNSHLKYCDFGRFIDKQKELNAVPIPDDEIGWGRSSHGSIFHVRQDFRVSRLSYSSSIPMGLLPRAALFFDEISIVDPLRIFDEENDSPENIALAASRGIAIAKIAPALKSGIFRVRPRDLSLYEADVGRIVERFSNNADFFEKDLGPYSYQNAYLDRESANTSLWLDEIEEFLQDLTPAFALSESSSQGRDALVLTHGSDIKAYEAFLSKMYSAAGFLRKSVDGRNPAEFMGLAAQLPVSIDHKAFESYLYCREELVRRSDWFFQAREIFSDYYNSSDLWSADYVRELAKRVEKAERDLTREINESNYVIKSEKPWRMLFEVFVGAAGSSLISNSATGIGVGGALAGLSSGLETLRLIREVFSKRRTQHRLKHFAVCLSSD